MSKLRKLVKRILIVTLSAVVLLALTAYLVLQYRIKTILKEMVYMETGGAYRLDFTGHKFSIFKANITLKNARFNCIRPVAGVTSYDVTIPNFYIGIDSWKTLLLDKKLVVDSLYAEAPEIKVMDAGKLLSGNKVSMQLNDAYHALRQVTNQLEIQTLAIKDAKVGLYSSDSSKPFVISHLTLGIHNFAWRTRESRHFLLTDDIDILIENQDWVLAAGDSLRFSRLHFSGKQQRFIIDSCTLTTTNIEKGRAIKLSADRFFANSSNLTAAYLNNQLIFDTLTCINPVMKLEKDETGEKDTVRAKGIVRKIFRNINFRYISIVDGQLLLSKKQDGGTVSYASQKSNIRLYDLNVTTGTPYSMTLRDLKFDLDTVSFYTPDSLYVLRVGNFSIQNSDLVCSNASFMPTSSAGSNLKLFLPQIILRNISLADLWQKKLKADQAEFERPDIIVTGRPGRRRKGKSGKKEDPYEILHDFNTVVDVKTMYIREGSLQLVPASRNGTYLKLSGMNSFVELNKLFQSGSAIDIKRTFTKAGFRNFQLISPDLKLDLQDVMIHGAIGRNFVGQATLSLPNGVALKAKGIFWHQLNWDSLYYYNTIALDQLSFKELNLRYEPTGKGQQRKVVSLPRFNISLFRIDKLNALLSLMDGTRITTRGKDMEFVGLLNTERGVQWKDVRADFENSNYAKKDFSVTVEQASLDKKNGSFLKNAMISYALGSVFLPDTKLSTTITDTRLSNLHLEFLKIDHPEIFLLGVKRTMDREKGFRPPFNLAVDELQINKALVNYHLADSVRAGGEATMSFQSFRLSKESEDLLKYASCELSVSNAVFENKKILATVPELRFQLPAAIVKRNGEALKFESDVYLRWANATIQKKDSSRNRLVASGLDGEWNYPGFVVQTGGKIGLSTVAGKVKLFSGNLLYADGSNLVTAEKVSSDVGKGVVNIEKLALTPNVPRAQFFENLQWQKDYQEMKCRKMAISGVNVTRLINDKEIEIGTISLDDAILVISRDKNLPFQHGNEKLMPTKLISTVRPPLFINKIQINNAAITSNEIAVATQREGSIPFLFVNGEIRNITNRPREGDSLFVVANAVLLDHYVRSFRYKESYTDSLSGFHLSARMSPMNLTVFSKISNPLAALEIRRGHADTLFTRLAGNKYGSFGEMKFYYSRLKVRFLNPLDTAKKNLGLSFKNFVANEFVLKSKNNKQVQVFYIRDAEKFIFNYWFKAIFSGVIASAGIRNDKKYVREYNRLKEIYSLPARE